jgi:hypothetical protein
MARPIFIVTFHCRDIQLIFDAGCSPNYVPIIDEKHDDIHKSIGML